MKQQKDVWNHKIPIKVGIGNSEVAYRGKRKKDSILDRILVPTQKIFWY